MKDLTITVSGKVGNCRYNILTELHTYLTSLGIAVRGSREIMNEIRYISRQSSRHGEWKPKDLSITLIGVQEPREDVAESCVVIGDVVSLLSGGPPMTVSDYTSNGDVHCVYFNDKQELQEVIIREELLTFDDGI